MNPVAAPTHINSLVQGVVDGDRRSLARCLRIVDDEPRVGRRFASMLHPHAGSAEVLGITGHPGAGKSTVLNLVPRLFDVTHGSITIDGQDVREVTLPRCVTLSPSSRRT